MYLLEVSSLVLSSRYGPCPAEQQLVKDDPLDLESNEVRSSSPSSPVEVEGNAWIPSSFVADSSFSADGFSSWRWLRHGLCAAKDANNALGNARRLSSGRRILMNDMVDSQGHQTKLNKRREQQGAFLLGNATDLARL